jgi:hypothetical protein
MFSQADYTEYLLRDSIKGEIIYSKVEMSDGYLLSEEKVLNDTLFVQYNYYNGNTAFKLRLCKNNPIDTAYLYFPNGDLYKSYLFRFGKIVINDMADVEYDFVIEDGLEFSVYIIESTIYFYFKVHIDENGSMAFTSSHSLR